MEEMKNGMISEEALEKVAGGINVNKEVLRKVLLGAGISVAAVLTATGVRNLCKNNSKKISLGAGSAIADTTTTEVATEVATETTDHRSTDDEWEGEGVLF